MRIGFIGDFKDEFRKEVEKEYKKYVIEFVEGIPSKSKTNTSCKRFCEVNGNKLKQFPIIWDDMRNCKEAKVNRMGNKYNPAAGKNRDKDMVEYLSKSKYKKLYISINAKYGEYAKWLAKQYNVPVQIVA